MKANCLRLLLPLICTGLIACGGSGAGPSSNPTPAPAPSPNPSEPVPTPDTPADTTAPTITVIGSLSLTIEQG
ncbi:hypothetical protein N9856_04300, partial [Porticoccaceae bacterium]|nr:hypothetical protein [Porticoccaceae bacterium]